MPTPSDQPPSLDYANSSARRDVRHRRRQLRRLTGWFGGLLLLAFVFVMAVGVFGYFHDREERRRLEAGREETARVIAESQARMKAADLLLEEAREALAPASQPATRP
jgi:type VI protein secretion system component VasK